VLLFRAVVPCCCSVLLFRAVVPCCCSVLLFRAVAEGMEPATEILAAFLLSG
jgi:hypothetical protein